MIVCRVKTKTTVAMSVLASRVEVGPSTQSPEFGPSAHHPGNVCPILTLHLCFGEGGCMTLFAATKMLCVEL